MGSDHNLGMVSAFAAVAGMVKKAEPPLLSTFDVFRVAHKAIWLGTVEATDERDAIQRVARERDIPAAWLIARRR
jgi:hypothetical protein